MVKRSYADRQKGRVAIDGILSEIDFLPNLFISELVFDITGLGSSSNEHLPFGGHGNAGPTIDSFRGTGLHISRSSAEATKWISDRDSDNIRRRVKFAIGGLLTALCALFSTIAILLAG